MGLVTRVDLEAVHEMVRDAARRGVPVVFEWGDDGGASPQAGDDASRSDSPDEGGISVSVAESPGGQLAAYDEVAAWAGRTIDGLWLASFLTEHANEIHGRGLTIVGARILGGLDLEGAALARRLALVHCQLGHHCVVLRDARTRTVQLDRISCGGIAAERARVGGSLLLAEIEVRGTVRLVDARIDASLAADHARIKASGDDAVIHANGVHIGGSLLLRGAQLADGPVRLSGATIGGDLFMGGASLWNPGGTAMRANSAEVGGSIYLDRGFAAEGGVEMFGVEVGRDVACADAGFHNPDRDAFALDGAQVGGGVFMQRSTVVGLVRLVNSDITGDLRCGGAHIEGSPEAALRASRATIGGNVLLDMGFVAEGHVRLPGASIGRSLRCGSATLSNPEGVALEADGTRIGASVQLHDGFNAAGSVRFVNASIGATLDCSRASLECGASDEPALDAGGVRVTGDVLLGPGFKARGKVRFVGATLDAQLNLTGARISNPDGISVHASGAQIGGTLFLTNGFEADGEVRLLGIAVGGDLYATNATISGSDGRALSLTRARITGDVVFGREFRAEGFIRIARAEVGGNLDCRGGTLSNPGGDALDASHTQVTRGLVFDEATAIDGHIDIEGITLNGNLDLGKARISDTASGRAVDADNARVGGAVYINGHLTGGVDMRGINVGGDLACSGAQIMCTNSEPAIKADRAQITGGLLLNRGFKAHGEVRFRGSNISGHASFVSAHIANPGGIAVNLGGARITGILALSDGYRAEGETRLPGTNVLRDVSCDGGQFLNPDGDAALNAAGLQVAGTLFIHDGFSAKGPVVLRGAHVDILQDDASCWPQRLDLDGFRYERLTCPPRDRGWRARRHWLLRQLTPSSEGYVQLAHVYRSAGDETDARRILIERHNALLRPPQHWHDQLPQGLLEVLRRAWRWTLRLTIGHGHAPERSLLIALPLVAMLGMWLTHARNNNMLVPTEETAVTNATNDFPRSSACGPDYPCVQPAVYAIDNLVPILELGQRSQWTPDQSSRGATWLDDGRLLAVATWATGALGWVLATLVAASFTRLVRRE